MMKKIMSGLVVFLMISVAFVALSLNVTAAPGDFHELYTFDSSNEGFVKVEDDVNSSVYWDSINDNVYLKSDRDDNNDERLEKSLPYTFTDESGDWELSVDFRVSQPGWWTHAYPVFIGNAANTELRWDSNQLNVVWERSDPDNITENANNHIIAFYRGADGQHYDFMVWDGAELEVTYTTKLSYKLDGKILKCQVFQGDTELHSGTFGIGPHNGFTFGKIGVSANGIEDYFPDYPEEPAVIGWADNIAIDYYPGGSGSYPGRVIYPLQDINPEDGVALGLALLGPVSPIEQTGSGTTSDAPQTYSAAVPLDGYNAHIQARVEDSLLTEVWNEFVWEFTITGWDNEWTFTETTSSPHYDSFRDGNIGIIVPGGYCTLTVEVKAGLDYANNYVPDPITPVPGNNNQINFPPHYFNLGSESIAYSTM